MTIVTMELDGADVTIDVAYKILYIDSGKVGSSRDDCRPAQFELDIVGYDVVKVNVFEGEAPTDKEIEAAFEKRRDYIQNLCEEDFIHGTAYSS